MFIQFTVREGKYSFVAVQNFNCHLNRSPQAIDVCAHGLYYRLAVDYSPVFCLLMCHLHVLMPAHYTVDLITQLTKFVQYYNFEFDIFSKSIYKLSFMILLFNTKKSIISQLSSSPVCAKFVLNIVTTSQTVVVPIFSLEGRYFMILLHIDVC